MTAPRRPRARSHRPAAARLAGGAALALVVWAVLVGTAAAHAQLLGTDPAPSSVLLVPPRQVVLTFDEPVSIDPGSVRVTGPTGARVDDGGAHHLGGVARTAAVGLPAGLARGTYVVAWQVVSDDGHPVHGAFVFSVGSSAGGPDAAALAAALAGRSGSAAVAVVAWATRMVSLGALLLLVGLLGAVLWAWPDGAGRRRVRRLLWASLGALAVATLADLAVTGAYGAGLPLGDVVHPAVVAPVLHTRFGEAGLARLALCALLVPVLLVATGRLGRGGIRARGPVLAVVVLGLGLLLTAGAGGHASVGTAPWLGLPLDVVHLAAAAAWLGGLVLLAAFLLPGGGPGGVPDDPLAVALRVSALAGVAVVVVVATGVVQALRQVGSRYALIHTDYGRTLLVKVAVVAGLVVAGGVSRRLLHQAAGHRDGPRAVADGAGLSPLRRSVVAELALVAVVLGVTGVLVNTEPARQAATRPVAASFAAAGLQIDAVVAPAAADGPNVVHIYVLTTAGTPQAVADLSAALRPPGRSVWRALPLVLAGPGHYTVAGVPLPEAGSWRLRVTLRPVGGGVVSVATDVAVH